MAELTRKLPVLMGLFALPCVVTAHHSIAAFYDRGQTAEVEGTVTSVFWRNPHIGLTLRVETETGEVQEWEIEGGTFNDLERQNFDPLSVAIGTRVRVMGAPSRRGENAIYLNRVLTAAGEELFGGGLGQRSRGIAPNPSADAIVAGIFKVWVNGGRLYQQRAPLSLTPAALAELADYDPVTDDPSLRCQAPGMPNANLNPYPIQFLDEGHQIILRIEEWDAIRTIHMDAAVPDDVDPTPLGYSTGRWEGETLVIETNHIDYPLLDDSGTPMSSDARILERYRVSDDDMRLDYEVTITDPAYLAEPAIWDAVWVWESGAQIKPFECAVR